MPISGKMYIWGDRAKYVPEKPGVYALYNGDKVLIYIGESSSLRERFTHYLETEFSDDPRKCETRYYRREFTSTQKERMKELLSEHQKAHGRLPECNSPLELPETEVQREPRFHFYESIGKPLHETASTLQDLRQKIGKIPLVSLEFHQKRGDFARWIREISKDVQLAEAFEKISETGENLRKELLNLFNDPGKAPCPTCGAETTPIKSWKMAGRPSRTGERLQLTLGHYKCLKCNNTFRRVIAKKKIKIE